MAEDAPDAKVSFPYMTAAQWFGIRAKLRQSVPKAIDIDWIMSALGTSEKGAKNIMPQLRAVGLLTAEGAPSELALDLRDDATYSEAAGRVLESLYPDSLRSAYSDPAEDPSRVASWFMRNAKTGQAAASMQAKLYLTLLKGELPSPDDAKATPTATRKPKASAPNNGGAKAAAAAAAGKKDEVKEQPPAGGGSEGSGGSGRSSDGPTLHIDLQIHISADAGRDQIDAMFESMAKHLYGR
ncbi:MAG: hypothetical protein DI534_13730 [Leifsonia xyli]|nr:MAG: hypothetical protein DI534_13730 [Leifsonia xyli]